MSKDDELSISELREVAWQREQMLKHANEKIDSLRWDIRELERENARLRERQR